MRTLSPGQILLLVAFLLVPLLNFVLTRWRRQRGDRPEDERIQPRAPEAPARAALPRPTPPSRVDASGDRPRRQAVRLRVPAEVPPGAARLTGSARLRPRDARRGVVLTAILGPCRALDPVARPPRAP